MYLDSAPVDDTKELATELAAKFNEARIVRSGRDAWESVGRAENFETWKRIGRALEVGRKVSLRIAETDKPEGRNYCAAFNQWIAKNGFAGMQKSVRSTAIEFWENIEAITAWRDTALTDRERRRLVHPLSNLRRWRKATAPTQHADASDPLRIAAAALGRFLTSMEAVPPDEAALLWQSIHEKAATFLGSEARTNIPA